MKIIVAIVVALTVWGSCAQLERSRVNKEIIAEAQRNASPNADVILYATDWCGYCRAARKFLDDKRIAYVEFDIEKSAEGERKYRALGVRGVPVLVVKGRVIQGYDPAGILAALK